jgi:hypothetical protein
VYFAAQNRTVTGRVVTGEEISTYARCQPHVTPAFEILKSPPIYGDPSLKSGHMRNDPCNDQRIGFGGTMRRIQKIREWSIWLVLLFVGFGAGFWLATTETVGFAAPRNSSLLGVPPAVVSYQGVIDINGNPFTGTGYFKFALVDSPTGNGSANYWANDGTVSGAPANAVQLAVNNGLFDVLLGDTSLANMSTPFDETAVAETVTYLRVWFSETGAGGSFEA